MKKQPLKLPKIAGLRFRFFIIAAVIFFIGWLAVTSVVKTLKTLDYFKIKEVIVSQPDIVNFPYLKGQNIFSVDLKKEAGYIFELYPNYKRIKIIRILPNRLFINFISRKAVGWIKLYRYFAVDEEGVLFDMSMLPQMDSPIILGLETKLFAPKVGRRYNLKELALALEIISQIRRSGPLKDYKVITVDVTHPAAAAFFIWGGLEIKVGQDNLKDKIAALNILLTQIKNDLANIRYIDLRFKEAVVKFKDGR
jgi:cell division septal protein FtsQ